MILLLRSDATAESVRAVVQGVRDLGLDVVPLHDLDGAKGQAFEVTGGDPGRVLTLAGRPGVAQILTRRVPLVGGEPLWPHFALRVGVVVLLLLVALLLLAAFLPVGLSGPAEAAASAGGTHAEWYLRPLEGVRGLLPPRLRAAGGAAVAAICLLLLAWPFVDRGPGGGPPRPASSRLLRAAGAAVFLGLLALGLLS